MALRDILAEGTFAVTAELSPPLNPVAAPVREAAAAIKDLVDAVNVTDNPAATAKVSALAAATWLLESDVAPILQVTTRDRNIMAIQSDLLGAWALGVRNVLALSGDPLKVGRYADIATDVKNVDSLGLLRLIRKLNDGELAAGETLKTPTGFFAASAMNPLVDSAQRIEGKIGARSSSRPTSSSTCPGSPSGSPRSPIRGSLRTLRSWWASCRRAAHGRWSTCTRTSRASRSTMGPSRGWPGCPARRRRRPG
jgi:methylenetetrahydrofolate reductase-like protein